MSSSKTAAYIIMYSCTPNVYALNNNDTFNTFTNLPGITIYIYILHRNIQGDPPKWVHYLSRKVLTFFLNI